jgi:tetratricopeptide (TPR) repeat protein
MARKKRESRGRRPKKPHQKPRLEYVSDSRAMEGVMRQLVTGLRGQAEQDTPLAKAQALMYQAFEEADEQRRLRFAKRALEICPNCADAYVVLAEHAQNGKEALALYQQGVGAGERALGPNAFERDVGHFWGILETRPYMRARLGLAHTLWTVGRREEAVQHLEEMLRLNPGDNQGGRYTLASFLLLLDRDGDLARLLQQYPDETSATWAYTKAVLAFRQQGDTQETRHLLEEARKTNKHVTAYLLAQKFPPPEQPSYYSPGVENEALNYVAGFMAGWKDTPGAVAWLRDNARKPRKKKDAPQTKGPLSVIKKWLNKNLPQEFDVWQADFRQIHGWIRVAGEMVRPWTVLVTSRSHDLVLGHQISDEIPLAALLWDTLVRAMQYPAAGTPHRPTELQVRADPRWEALRPHLEEIGLKPVVTDAMDEIRAVFKDMAEQVCGKPRPGLLDMPGVTPAHVGAFYDAAAFFFRHAPWKKVGDEATIKIECDRYQSGPWYAVVMGRSGLTMGLALYEDLNALRRIWTSDRTQEETAREGVVTGVTFGEEWTIPVADLDAAMKYGWPLARPDAYPEVFHKERGLSLRPPLAWQLELMEACLRSVPDFVNHRQQEDPAREEFTVPVASEALKLVLSWVIEPNAQAQRAER